MKKEKIFMDVTEVAEVLDVSESYAYKLIRKMNVELKENGFITIGGKINREFPKSICTTRKPANEMG